MGPQPCFGIAHQIRVGFQGAFHCSESGPDQGSGADVAETDRCVAPASVFVHVIVQPFESCLLQSDCTEFGIWRVPVQKRQSGDGCCSGKSAAG